MPPRISAKKATRKVRSHHFSKDGDGGSRSSHGCSGVISIFLLVCITCVLFYAANNHLLSILWTSGISAEEVSKMETAIMRAQNIVGDLVTGPVSISDAYVATRVDSLTTDLQKDIIIGMAHNIDPRNLAVFCASFRKVNSAADVVLFVNEPIPERHASIAAQYSIHLIGFTLDSMAEATRKFHPSTFRWPLMYDFFDNEAVRKKYSRVWMADVRDTFFQLDPFEMLPLGQKGFYVFSGVEHLPIISCGWNGGWVKDCLGQEVLSRIGSRKIICSGVSMGDIQSVYAYLELMTDVILAEHKTALGQYSLFPTCERNGVDQGVHNALVHTDAIPGLKIFGQGDGPVTNLQAKVALIVPRASSGATRSSGSSSSGDEGNNNAANRLHYLEVRNQRGDLAAVVHQYDRFPELQAQLFSQYVTWTSNPNDASSQWIEEKACRDFDREADKDLFKGICDLKLQGGAADPSSCCRVCASHGDSCRAFTYFSGICYLKSCSTRSSSGSMPGALSAIRKQVV